MWSPFSPYKTVCDQALADELCKRAGFLEAAKKGYKKLLARKTSKECPMVGTGEPSPNPTQDIITNITCVERLTL